MSSNLPMVSILVPMLNELGAIEECLDGFAAQTYPSDLFEVLVVDGGSTDGSLERVAKRAATEPWIRVVANPDRRASSAFNRGVEAARGSVVCLFSAHGLPSKEYIEHSVAVLSETGAGGVGGRYEHVGTDPSSRAIGFAMSSPFGMASSHRFATVRRVVDTISHPAYVRDAMLAVGPFDERLLRNSDYEFNFRMRERGYELVFDPRITSIYRPRPSLRALARQFWWYGRWKARVAKAQPRSVRARHLVAPAATALVLASPLLWRVPFGRRWLLASAGAYAMLLVGAVGTSMSTPNIDRRVVAAAFPTMHLCWGAGFLASIVEDGVRR